MPVTWSVIKMSKKSTSSELETLEIILDLMQESANTAVDVDRFQDKRIWSDLNLLMSGDHIDYIHVKVLLPKFLTNYGDFQKITPPLIDQLTKYIDIMHDLNIKIKVKEKFPNASLPSLSTLKRQYNQIKSQWDKTLLYAMKQVNLDTTVKYDKYALLQVLAKKDTSNGNVESLKETLEKI